MISPLASRIASTLPSSLSACRCRYTVASPTCSPLRRSSAWISWALQKPGRLSSAAARACACRVPRTRVPRAGREELTRTFSSGCGIVTVARYNLYTVLPNRPTPRDRPGERTESPVSWRPDVDVLKPRFHGVSIRPSMMQAVLQTKLGIVIITAKVHVSPRTEEFPAMRSRYKYLAAVVPLGVALLASGCSAASASGSSGSGTGTIVAVGAENEYASVLAQVGGKYVQVSAIMSNPATDPHTFEASASVARLVSEAQLVVQNGAGYDRFMNTIENAAPSSSRKVIVVQDVLGLPASTPNPHLWYKPSTMPAVANAIAADLATLQPAHASYFKANAAAFIGSLAGWNNALAAFKAKYPNTPVATTEPVADYMLQAAGANNLTPFAFQADIMNGTDPSAQNVAVERSLFTQHKVKVFLYNQQVTSSLTQSFITLARANGIPVVGVYETMPVPGFNYQSWMLTEVQDLQKAVVDKISTEHL